MHISTIGRDHTSAVPWQQWLCERATVLHYTYNACLLSLVEVSLICLSNQKKNCVLCDVRAGTSCIM